MRVVAELAEREPLRNGAELIAVHARAHEDLDGPIDGGPSLELRGEIDRVFSGERGARLDGALEQRVLHELVDERRWCARALSGGDERELGQDVLFARTRVRHDRRRPLDEVSYGELHEHELVLAARERRRGRQDDVRVARRLVAVGIDAHDAIERMISGDSPQLYEPNE